MPRILVNSPSGEQKTVDVGIGGGYFDVSRVLWDERVDGSLPEITLGGMVRIGNALAVDEALLASSNEAKALLETKKANSEIKRQIAALDQKRIRPLAEGDTVYLAKLNAEIAALGAQMIPPRKAG